MVGLDRFGRIVDHFWVNYGSSTVTDEFTYGYDRNSNRLYRNNLVDTTFGELYAYDNFDQLSAFARGTLSITTSSATIVGSPTRSQNWDPHPLGNAEAITTDGTPESRGYNAQNQFTTVGGNSITYDANGNLTTDQNGNIYRYDAWNRLVKVEDSSTNLLTAYSYNPLNRRIIEDDGSTETHLFYSANWQVLEEQVSGQTTTQYVWSPVYIDAMILRDRDTDANGSLDERLYVQQDANWNVTALVDALTGDVVQRFVQDPFGLVTVLDSSFSPTADAFDWKYLHQGLRLEMAVGMNLYDGRNRIYDPVLQRWLQVDPSGFDAGDSNLYRYVGNGPVNAVDPSGLVKEDERILVVTEFKQEKFKGVAAKILSLMAKKEREFQIVLGWKVSGIVDEGKNKCQIEYRMYGFEVSKKAINFLAALKITGIRALDTLITKLPEELRKIELEGEVGVISQVYISDTLRLEGNCNEIKIDAVKKSLQQEVITNAGIAALRRLGTPNEQEVDLRNVFHMAAVVSMINSLRE